MQIASSEEMTRFERNVPWLAITGAVTPFIGLFGTVWGIIDAFHGLGTSGNSYLDLMVKVYDISANPAAEVFPDITVNTSTGSVVVTFASSVTLSNYQVTIIGA